MENIYKSLRNSNTWDTWLAQSEQRTTLDIGLMSLSPTLNVGITLK